MSAQNKPPTLDDDERALLAVLDRRIKAFREAQRAEAELEAAEDEYDSLMQKKYGPDWRKEINWRKR